VALPKGGAILFAVSSELARTCPKGTSELVLSEAEGSPARGAIRRQKDTIEKSVVPFCCSWPAAPRFIVNQVMSRLRRMALSLPMGQKPKALQSQSFFFEGHTKTLPLWEPVLPNPIQSRGSWQGDRRKAIRRCAKTIVQMNHKTLDSEAAIH
jgi:hypothetical protein